MLSLLSISAGATTAITVAVVAVVFLLILMLFLPIGTYFIAAVSNAHISMGRLVGMKMRRIKYKQCTFAQKKQDLTSTLRNWKAT